MFRLFALSLVVLFTSHSLHAAEPQAMNVWPGKPPGNLPEMKEQWTGKKVTNVSVPTLTLIRPEDGKANGAAVIVCPGGGYKALMMDYEGEDVAKWFATQGFTALVLKYRLPAPEGTPRWLPALQDAQRSVSFVRSKAKEWSIDPARIGILGFSAGGHLSGAASTNFDKRAYEASDEIDKQSCRPDFAVLIYPGGLLEKTADGKANTDKLSAEITVTEKTPPTFMAMATDDRVGVENCVQYYLALKKAAVPAEMHLYSAGGHGFGIKPSDKPAATWPARCVEWLGSVGMLKK